MDWDKDFKNYRFEELEVWQVGLKIVKETYRVAKKYPPEERFGLGDQHKRAAVSIALNVAEGSGQPTKKGFIL